MQETIKTQEPQTQVVQRFRNDGTPAFDDAHKTRQYESFLGDGEAGDDHYEAHGKLLRQWLDSNAAKEGEEVLGRAASAISWKEFLAKIPEERRSSYNCNCCARWFKDNATTVAVDKNGNTRSLFWTMDNVPEVLKEAYAYAKEQVEAADVAGFFHVDSVTRGSSAAGEVVHNGEKKKFAHYHIAGVKDISAPNYPANTVMTTIISNLPNADRVQTRGADLRKAILEIESKDGIVLGHIRMLDGFLGICSFTGRARSGQYPRNKAWNATYFQLAANKSIAHFNGSSIGTALNSYLDGEVLASVVELYFKNIDPVKYKRATREAADGRLVQAEKFFEANDYAQALPLKVAAHADLIASAEIAQRLMWRDSSVKPVVKEAPAESTTLLGHLRKGARDEIEASKIEKPRFKSESVSLRAFIKNWLPKAIKLKIENPAAKTAGAARLSMSSRDVSRARMSLGGMLSTMITQSNKDSKGIWKYDAGQQAANGARWPFMTYNLDVRSSDYLERMASYWSGLGQAEFEVTEVVLGRFLAKDGNDNVEDRDVISSLHFIVPSVASQHNTKEANTPNSIRPSYFPHSLIQELQDWRDVMEQYISDRGYDSLAEDEQPFGVFVITADPEITIVVETNDGYQPLTIATIE